jgi:colicin import membrane protein
MGMRFHSDPLRPLRPNHWGTGGLIAFTAHTVLLISMTLAMNWPRHNTISASAELWSSIPIEAASTHLETVAKPEPKPTPEPPPPTPEKKIEPERPSVDIALEKQRLEKKKQQELEKLRLEKEKKVKHEQMLKEKAQKSEEKEAEKRRAENLARITGMAKASKDPKGTGSATQSSGPSASYAGRIKARIKPNIVYSSDLLYDDKTAEVEVRLSMDGTIMSRKLIKSSGVRDWDDAVLRAIDRTEILPRDTDGSVPPVIIISFNRQDR